MAGAAKNETWKSPKEVTQADTLSPSRESGTSPRSVLDELEQASKAEREALVSRDWRALQKLVSHKELLLERIELHRDRGGFTRSQLMRVERLNRRNHELASKLIEGVNRRVRHPDSGQTYNRSAVLNEKRRALLHRMG
jgi:Skp family chaperone for outer membrane proteins